MGRASTVQAGIPAWLNAILAIGGLGTLISGLGVWWKNHRDGELAEKKDSRDANKDDVEVFSDWMTAAKESAKEAAEARRDAALTRAELHSVRIDVDSLLDRVSILEAEIHDERSATAQIAGYVTVILAGIEAGTIPPVPRPSPQVQAILSRIEHKEQP